MYLMRVFRAVRRIGIVQRVLDEHYLGKRIALGVNPMTTKVTGRK